MNTRTRYWGAVCGGLFLLARAGAVATTGDIQATITGPVSVDRVWAVNLQDAKHIEGKVSGGKSFQFTGLPLGTYGLVLKSGNSVIEGIRYPDEIYVGNDLVGQNLGDLREEVLAQEIFFNNKTIWSIQGGTKKAIAFVFEERSKSWSDNASGNAVDDMVVRRFDVELWHKSGTAWLQDTWFFLWREQLPRSEAKPMTHTFDEQLAGIAVTAEQPHAKVRVKF